MSDDASSELIAQFMAMTNASHEEAEKHLALANNDLQNAVNLYLDSTAGEANPIHVHSSTDRAQDAKRKDRQTYYAGGQQSGVLVQGPGQPDQGNDLVENILKKAAEGGAHEEIEAPRPKKSTGKSYRLGDSSSGESSSTSARQAPPEPAPVLEKVTRRLTFWRNGFNIEEGPFYPYDDPAGAAYLKALDSGQAPPSLFNVEVNQPVDVQVAKRLDEEYVPKPKPKPKTGKTYRLGSPSQTPTATTTGSAATATPKEVPVDENLPVTRLQIRLADGSRLIARFNHTHTLRDVRQYVDSHRPNDTRAYSFYLVVGSKMLEDENQTLADAGILNSVLIQRHQ